MARTLAPAMLVVEDVDLIAEDRGMHPGHHSMLFPVTQRDGRTRRVSAADLDAALDELLDTRNTMTRVLLGAGDNASPTERVGLV